MTLAYKENMNNLSGLQADSRRDRGDRIAYLIDLAIEKCRSTGLIEGNISELQHYYYKTIERNTAFHGAGCKIFKGLANNMSLVLTFSSDCQYPIDFFLMNSQGYIVNYIASFKNIQVSINRLKAMNLKALIIDGMIKYQRNQQVIDQLLVSSVTSRHFRYFKKQCLQVLGLFE